MTAVVRDGRRLKTVHPHLTVVEADVMDPAEIKSALIGTDAVISALGPRSTGPTTVVQDGARSVIAAMESAGAKRLVMVSASGPFTDGDGYLLKYLLKPLVQRVLRHAFADVKDMERLVIASSLQWTVVRPPRVTAKPATGTYRTELGVNVRAGYTLSRHDLAECLLRTAADPGTAGDVIFVAK